MSGYRLEDGNIIKSVFLAYFILGFHVVILCGLGGMVLFFNIISHYFMWILLFSAIALTGSGFFLLRYIHRQRISLSKLISLPEFKGRNIEINLLGGLASIKISGENIPADSALKLTPAQDNPVDTANPDAHTKEILIMDCADINTKKNTVTTNRE